MRARNDRGQALPVVLALVALVALVGIGIAAAGTSVLGRQQAQSAADAVALAGLLGRDAAEAVAAANDATLVRWTVVLAGDDGMPRVVEVEVAREGVRAVARASRDP